MCGGFRLTFHPVSGCRELNPGLTHPMRKYYHYTTPRMESPRFSYFEAALMHLVHAFVRPPEGSRNH